MKLDFRIDWGYQYLYSRRHYHPTYIWDGSLTCEKAEIKNTYILDYPYIPFGPGHCAKETNIDAPVWQNRTRRGLSGVRIEADAEPDAVFHLHTVSIDLIFRASELLENGKLLFRVGPKYLGCYVTVTLTDFLWFRQPLKEGEVAYEPDELGLPVHHWARMKLAWLEPGKETHFRYEVRPTGADIDELLIHLVMMGVPAYTDGRETQVRSVFPFTLLVDGEPVLTFSRFLRHHDTYMQLLEDDWQRVRIPAGQHILTLRNDHPELCVGISRIVLKTCGYNHGQLSVPDWALKNENVIGKVYAVRDDVITATINGDEKVISCVPGWNEFAVCISEPGIAAVKTFCDEASIEIFDVEEEEIPVKVGYDMTVVPHDDSGFMDWLLDYTQRTRLGNYVLFRSFTGEVDPSLWSRWGTYCRDHGIHVATCTDYLNGALTTAAGDMLHDVGRHEYPGKVYIGDPTPPHASTTMKEAAEKYIAYLKAELDTVHAIGAPAAFGDASGGIRYSFLAGADFMRAETMVSHTMQLLAQARPAAEALGNGRWGVHIAIQHAYQPYQETHLGQYFLSLMQPWVMGAEVIYEEDCLFTMFKEERIAWDDLLTKGKRDMTRNFFKFVKTHPRKGKNTRAIAFIEGRYAAPFNGFICGFEQDPHYTVWGLFGSEDPTWGHGQPEKCRQLLDVLMPGANTMPLRQRHDRRRFFFSGTPFGDFDCVPVEAETPYLKNYKLLLNLGWNTAADEDLAKLEEYVRAGGTLLTGIPQFSTHITRDFLADMQDLALIHDGDLSRLCGIRVNGRGTAYCGQWNCAGREAITEPELAAMPSDDAGEDGPAILADVTLTGAEIVAWDTFTGKPMLVRRKLGKGYVYTFTIWAYPGHEGFQKFCAAWIEQLSARAAADLRVIDPTRETFWTVWENGDEKIVMLLNTDWTVKGNVKNVTLCANGSTTEISLREREVTIVSVRDDDVKVQSWSLDT
ncbi:MAG: hypothetical protein E7463_07920 [Ruminococcaceae bacterium]|nr:hypothetical protein [Oscillospiraceae bacterium]